MPTRVLNSRSFDVRPDRIDFRDLPYRAQLVSLPEEYPYPDFVAQHLFNYTESLILNQGTEGACTGFGLAAVVNYLLWKRELEADASVPLAESEYELRRESLRKRESAVIAHDESVSSRMLYHMARIYDEWQGEDYDGSSCRGALKGWHRHGVCREMYWRYVAGDLFGRPAEGWERDAAEVPLGAYYRINKDSINDMQSAIREVGAIYVAANVHEGWFLGEALYTPSSIGALPMIMPGAEAGGHAFAIIGYTREGFVVQNSWGTTWGYSGFAILPYTDWVQHGVDAWVAVLGAPVDASNAGRTQSSLPLRDVADDRTAWYTKSDRARSARRYVNPAVEPWPESFAYPHTVVLGNNGLPINRFLDEKNAKAAVREVAFRLPDEWAAQRTGVKKIAIYAHGGLNSEAASIKRIRVLAPYFFENDIYPIFVTWKTGMQESLGGIVEDWADSLVTEPGSRAKGFLGDVAQAIQDAKDRAFEAVCNKFLVRACWTEMKENAEAGADTAAGLTQLAQHLAALKAAHEDLEVHLVGHSAGSLVLGHLLTLLGRRRTRVPVSTTTLYAPACTVDFALQHYAKAFANGTGILRKQDLHVDLLSDPRERDDQVFKVYGKSLLYLVSRALERFHKTPLLGMEAAWNPAAQHDDMWNDRTLASIDAWRVAAKGGVSLEVYGRDAATGEEVHTVSDGVEDIPLNHGSFDNNVAGVAKTLRRIRGKKLLADVERLRGF